MVNKDKERYSFSKLSTFNDCKYAYWLTYIEHQKGVGNCFSSFGTEVHSIMERYAKGSLSLWDLASTYEKEFDTAVPEEFPSFPFCQDMRGLYYEQGLNYLRNFGGYPKYKILGVESQFDIAIDDWVFNGIIDLVYEDEQGRLVVHDYKSKSSFKNKAEQKKYARQLYLYSLHIKEKYGKYPDLLRFMMFRKETSVDIPFKTDDLNEAVNWAKNTVKAIRTCWDYSPSCEEFFGNYVCNHRKDCEHKI